MRAGLAGDRLGRDRGVVEVAEPAVHRARGVMPGRPAQPVGGALAAEHEVGGRQGDVDRGPRGRVRALDDVRGRVERPVAGAPVRPRRLVRRTARSSPRSPRGSGSSRARGSRTGARRRTASSQAVSRNRSRPGSWTAVIGLGAVLRGRDELEPAVGDQRRADDLGPLGDLVRVAPGRPSPSGSGCRAAGGAASRRSAWPAMLAARASRRVRRSRGSRR